MKRLRIPSSLNIDKLIDKIPAPLAGFKIDKVYFVCDAVYKCSLKLDESTHIHPLKKMAYYVPLHSDILSHYLGAAYYTKIIEWMVAAEIIEIDGSYENKIVSLGYRFTKQYRLDQSKRVDVSDFKMYTKKRYKQKERKSLFKTSRTVTQLKKWYNGLSIDRQDTIDTIAYQYENELYNANTKEKWEHAISLYNNSHAVLDIFDDDLAECHFQDETGRRLHTVLTRLPRHLRRHVKYKGKELAQTDLSNSQLFFTTLLLNAKTWTKSRKNQTNQLWRGLDFVASSSYSIMSSVSSETQASKDSQRALFVQLACSGQIYDYFVARMDKLDGFFTSRMTYDQKRDKVKLLLIAQINGDASLIGAYQTWYNFKAIGIEPKRKRRSTKKVLQNLRLYSGHNFLLWQAFITTFPEIADIYSRIKRYNNYDLSHVLQRIESTGVLEFACKEIGKKLPHVPLFTLHDCIVTTVDFIDKVDVLFKQAIKNYVGHTPKTKISYWSECQEVAPVDISCDWNSAA